MPLFTVYYIVVGWGKETVVMILTMTMTMASYFLMLPSWPLTLWTHQSLSSSSCVRYRLCDHLKPSEGYRGDRTSIKLMKTELLGPISNGVESGLDTSKIMQIRVFKRSGPTFSINAVHRNVRNSLDFRVYIWRACWDLLSMCFHVSTVVWWYSS